MLRETEGNAGHRNATSEPQKKRQGDRTDSPALRARIYRRFDRAVVDEIDRWEHKHGPATAPMLGELIARARGLDPEAVARLCDAMEDVLAEPDRKVGAALGISAARLRARDEALRKLAQALAAPGKSIAQIAREVCREARRRGIALSERHIRRIIE